MSNNFNQTYVYQSRLTSSEIEKKVKQLLTETLDFNEEKFGGYIDGDYFKLIDNESYRLGKPALIEGRVSRGINDKTKFELTVKPTQETITHGTLGVLMLIITVSLFLLFEIPYPSLTKTRISLFSVSITLTILAIRSNYYSSKNTVVKLLDLEKHR